MARPVSEPDDDGFGEASRYTAHLDRGWSLLDRGDFEHARASAQQALELRADIPDAAMLMAAISLADHNPEAALHWYERAIDIDAEYVDAQLAAAQVLLYDLDEPERALARAGQGRELDEASIADLIDFGVIEAEAMVSLGDRVGAAQRLGELPELWILEEILDPETDREHLAELLVQFAGTGWGDEGLEPEDTAPLMGRVISLAIRVARMQIEVGAPTEALAWIDALLQRFGDDADVWYLCNEAAYFAGEPVRAAQAALQVLQLDARAPMPAHTPDATELHAKVVELLIGCGVHELRELARDPNFIVIVNDAPPFELALEGVDPRVRVLTLATRALHEVEPPVTLTGIAIYRRNLGRLARDPASVQQELAYSLFDELSVFFGFDEAKRAQLGLPATEIPHGPESRSRARELELAAAATLPEAERPPSKRETKHRETKHKAGKASKKPSKSKSKSKSKAKAKAAATEPKPDKPGPAARKSGKEPIDE